MNVSLSALKENPAKYFELAKVVDVVVTRRGGRLGRIVCEEKALKSERAIAFIELMELTKTTRSEPDESIYDPIKEERLREKGLLQ